MRVWNDSVLSCVPCLTAWGNVKRNNIWNKKRESENLAIELILRWRMILDFYFSSWTIAVANEFKQGKWYKTSVWSPADGSSNNQWPMDWEINDVNSDGLLLWLPKNRAVPIEATGSSGFLIDLESDFRHWPANCQQFPQKIEIESLIVFALPYVSFDYRPFAIDRTMFNQSNSRVIKSASQSMIETTNFGQLCMANMQTNNIVTKSDIWPWPFEWIFEFIWVN